MNKGVMTADATQERDNDAMNDGRSLGGGNLPPPTGAPVGGESANSKTPPPPGGSFWDSLPFDDPKEAALWWYGPLRERSTWISVGYLAAGAVLGPLVFTAVVVMLSVSLSLVLIIVGIPLTVLSFTAIDKLAALERSRAEWIGPPIPPRPLARPTGPWWRRVGVVFTDPARWRQVACLLAGLVVWPVFFFVGTLPLVIVIQAVFGAGWLGANVVGAGLGGLLVAVLMAGAISRVAIFATDLAHSYVAWFLGPDRTGELEARVESLSEQRQEILDAVSAERRRIERNLHDGVQQQLVALGIDIGRASARIESDPEGARRLLDDARDKVRASVGELRVIGRGLHPAVLDDRGLDAALSAVVSGSPIPIDVVVSLTAAVSTEVAATAYYVANEAVANVLKHAKARVASIHVSEATDEIGLTVLVMVIHDDGRGGASLDTGGTGLAGMAARVRAMDGAFSIDSPKGGPTTVTAEIPVA